MVTISSWGNIGDWEHDIYPLTDRRYISKVLHVNQPGLPFGSGRSYGDVCLNPQGILWQTTSLDRFISFDEKAGLLVCETGILLRDIQRLVIPYGWMLPVTPGTQLITLGGAIANDVHGKNHHALGTFGDHIKHMTLVRTDGEIIECGPTLNQDWFFATLGGVGLTGIILIAEIQLRPISGPWIETETIAYQDMDEFFYLADSSEADWEYTVSWVDCLSGGRGIFMRGNHTETPQCNIEPKKRNLTVPITPPLSLINRFSLKPFNSTYFNLKKRQVGQKIVHYSSFFYPLDNLLQWNRLYGPKGFYQYQCVVPFANGKAIIQAILNAIAVSGEGSFLAVLKTFGARQPLGMLSFPQPGITLALDFPNKSQSTLTLFERLDAIVHEVGGRVYLAKDMRMSPECFAAGYPKLPAFLPFRDPGISSAMSRRLIGY